MGFKLSHFNLSYKQSTRGLTATKTLARILHTAWLPLPLAKKYIPNPQKMAWWCPELVPRHLKTIASAANCSL